MNTLTNKRRYNLSNKYIFILLSCILIFILTFINNLYFYSHVERTSTRNSVQLEKLLLNYIENNNLKDSAQLEKELFSLIKTWIDKSYYTREINIINLNNETIPLMKPNKWDYAASTKLVINFKELISKKEDSFLLTSQTNLEEIFYTVMKSMTFSISDIIKDISTNIYSEIDGKIISIKDVQEKLYDGIINVNGKKFEDIKGVKSITILNQRNNETKNYFIPPYNKVSVTEGMTVKQKEIIAEGTIYTALDNLQNIYWLRSRPFIGFTIFTVLILFIFRKRTEQLQKIHLEEKEKIEADARAEELIRIAEIERLEAEIERKTQEQAEMLQRQNQLKEEAERVCAQFNQYQDFVKFAFENTPIDELLDKNRRILGNIFRLVAEKIVYSIYENEIRPVVKKRDNLDSCLQEIKPLNLLSGQAINALYAVKNFGNDNSHYSRDADRTSLAKTIVIASDLIYIIKEYLKLENNLNNSQNKDMENIEKITKSGIKIVKKVSSSSSKF